jgi:hypothetical protein
MSGDDKPNPYTAPAALTEDNPVPRRVARGRKLVCRWLPGSFTGALGFAGVIMNVWHLSRVAQAVPVFGWEPLHHPLATQAAVLLVVSCCLIASSGFWFKGRWRIAGALFVVAYGAARIVKSLT